MERTVLIKNPSVMIFIAVLAIITLGATFMSEAFGTGILSTSFIKTLGKTLCLCLIAIAMDLVWGYCGILSLGHFAFFGLGGYMIGMWLMWERTKDIVLGSFEGRALPPTTDEVRDAIGTQIFGVVGSSEIPPIWFFADSLI
ncbi:MAG: urea ABC transporter permease subunit UrtC, partial [Pseudomonadota bacterium]